MDMTKIDFSTIDSILQSDIKQVEERDGYERFYSSSSSYGESRYHILSRQLGDGFVIEQNDLEDKYKPAVRIQIKQDEVPGIIKALLCSYQNDLNHYSPVEETSLDDHPF